MPLTYLLEPPRREFTCGDPGRGQTTVERPSRPSSDQQSTSVGHRLSGSSAGRKAVSPTLHHFGLKTSNLDAMVDWYGKVLGMKPNHRTQATAPRKAIPGGRLRGSATILPIIAFPSWRFRASQTMSSAVNTRGCITSRSSIQRLTTFWQHMAD